MARVFISFPMEDRFLRDFLVGQKRNSRNPIEFTDYSVKQAWSSSWKTNCRQKIKSCRGVIGVLTHHTLNAEGQLWELRCAVEEGVPLLLIHGYREPHKKIARLPPQISGRRVNLWTQDNVVGFLDRLEG